MQKKYIYKIVFEDVKEGLVRYFKATSIIQIYRYLNEVGASVGSISLIQKLKKLSPQIYYKEV